MPVRVLHRDVNPYKYVPTAHSWPSAEAAMSSLQSCCGLFYLAGTGLGARGAAPVGGHAQYLQPYIVGGDWAAIFPTAEY